MANEIRYKVGFDLDKNSLNQIKSALQEIQKLNIKDIMNFNKGLDISEARKALNDVRSDAGKV